MAKYAVKHNKKLDSSITRVAIYIRVSTAKQKNTGESLETQQEALLKYVEEHENMIIADTYIDGGISGQKLKRDEFTRLMDDVKDGKIDLILFTRLDRWFRNLRHFLNTNVMLEDCGCSWTAVNQPFYDTTTPHGRAFVNQSMIYAQLEAENDGERIRYHNEGKVARGEVLSGSVSIGFKIEDKHYVPNDDNHIIKEMYDYYEANQNLNSTRQWLEDSYGIVRSQPIVKRILKDERNKGCYRGNESWCPATVSPEQWGRVQRLITMNVKSGSKRKEYIFSGILRCECCDGKITGSLHCMLRMTKNGKKRYTYKAYRCPKHFTSKSLCSNNKVIFEPYIEKYLLNNVFQLITQFTSDCKSTQKPVASNKKKRDNLLKKIDRLKDLYINELITMDEYRTDKTIYLKQLENIPDDIFQEKDLTHLKKILDIDLHNLYKTMNDSEKRSFWRSFIKDIYIDGDRNIRIVFL